MILRHTASMFLATLPGILGVCLVASERRTAILDDHQLGAMTGRDDMNYEYESNCAYTSLGKDANGKAQVSWRDCNGQTGSQCVHCEEGDFLSNSGSSTKAKVRKTGHTVDCDSSTILKKVGVCLQNKCQNYSTGVGSGCAGTPDRYTLQPTDL